MLSFSFQSRPILCGSMACSRQVPLSMRILQARILEWVAMPSSRVSSQPTDKTQVSRIAGGFSTNWGTREALLVLKWALNWDRPRSLTHKVKMICRVWCSLVENGQPTECCLTTRVRRKKQEAEDTPGKSHNPFAQFPNLSNFQTEHLPAEESERVKVTQSCPTLCDPIVHGILQTGILEWVAISFSMGSLRPSQLKSLPAKGYI